MKKRNFVVTALAALALTTLGIGALAGCNGGEKKPQPSSQESIVYCALTWKVAEHAKVTVEGYDDLPSQVEEDTAISFTVQVDEGYEVDSVKANNKKVSFKNEKYTVGITRDTEIIIEVSQAITDLKVQTNPTKLSYIAGESIDLTGLVVVATLGNGETKTIEYNEDTGYSVYPTVFMGGETSFEITYKDQTISVQLNEVVQFKVVIDANGGQFTQSYLDTLSALNLNNYSHSNGVITFTYYNNLSSPVPMPKTSDVTRENYSLTGWSYANSVISNATSANVEATASWQIELVSLSSVRLSLEGNVPYLIIEGKFKAATEVYLYLYEGNAKVELKGDTYTGSSNQDFEVKFDLRRLSEQGADFEGKWMDIRFNAKVGNTEESMEIFVNSTSTIEVDTAEKVITNNVSYVFAVYNSALKVYFQNIAMTYELLCHAVTEGGVTTDYLRISGQTSDSAHFNKYVHISCWGSGETEGYGANIDASGHFAVEYPLQDFASLLKTNIFFHIGIYEDSSRAQNIWGGTSTNVAISSVLTPISALAKNLGDIHHANKYVGSDGLSYYVGYAWDGLMLYVVDEGNDITLEMAKVEEREGVIYYVLTGTCAGYTSDNFLYGFYFQHINNLDGLGEGDVYDNNAVDQHAVVDASGNFEISCPVSTLITPSFKASSDAKWGLIAKYYVGDKKEVTDRIEIKAPEFSAQTITKDGVRYSIYAGEETWSIDCLVLEKI